MNLKLLTLLCVVTLLSSGCAMTSAKHTIVFGESFASTSEAVQEARNAVRNAEGLGCKAISIGSGGAGAAVESGGGLVLNVVVLLECPAGTPNILAATGQPTP